MRAFLSYSSIDQATVVEVHERLGATVAWMDRAEIEWGDYFLDRVSKALQESTDFVLFWSRNSEHSEWVRLELHMAFIRRMQANAIRLHVVRLDDTELPLHLQPFQFIDVSASAEPVAEIVAAIAALDASPRRVLRHRFLNRHDELSRMETAIDDPETYLLVFGGFAGIGKQSLAREGLQRLFEGVEIISIDVNEGTGITELALYLNTLARGVNLVEGLTVEELRKEIGLSMEEVVRSGRFLLFNNVQHWLDDDRIPVEPLITVLDTLASIPSYKRQPCLMTSTRRISYQRGQRSGITEVWVDGLSESSVSSLLKLWFELDTGSELNESDAGLVAQQLHGHPIAAKLAAGLVAQFGVDYLQQYPKEYVSLRRDLAKALLLGLQLFVPTSDIMKALAATEVPLPPVVLQSALGLNDEEFHQGIAQATSAGLIVATDGKLGIHPLIADHFWNLLHREDYSAFLSNLAKEVHSHATEVGVGSREFSLLVPAIFKLYAAAGDWKTARQLRSDLQGEMERAAIFHYRRRNYDLAWEYVNHALDGANPSRAMYLYKARILVRKENWMEADEVLGFLLRERPTDVSTLHAQGWKLLRQRLYEEALAVFAKVISQREHVASLRDSAECLHQLDRNDEALDFLARAKAVESDNPYVLDLEARILEERGELEAAHQAMLLAVVRDPNNWAFHHRLGIIRNRQGQLEAGIVHLRTAVGLDQDQFTPRHALIATLLDLGDISTAESLLEELSEKASTRTNQALVEHLKARVLMAKGDIEEAARLLEEEIRRNRNLLPNLGLYADAKLRQSIQLRHEFPATSNVEFERAANAVTRGLGLDGENGFLLELQQRIEAIRSGEEDGV